MPSESDETRLDSLRTQMARQVDLVAHLICSGDDAIASIQLLEHLNRELAVLELRMRLEEE